MIPGKRLARRYSFIAVAVLVATAMAAVLLLQRSEAPTDEVAFSDFLRHVEQGAVAQVVIGDEALEVALKNGRRVRTIAPRDYVAANPSFVTDLTHRQVRVLVRRATGHETYNIGGILVALLFFAMLGFTVYHVTAGRIPSVGNKARLADKNATTVTFADVAGVDEAKDEVKEVVDFLREPEKFSAIGGRIPKGVLLVGPPGTGKTLLARSIAGEASVPFLFASGADFVEMYAGVGAARVRRLFREARRHKSCIVFIDELDAVGRKRGGDSMSLEEREQTLNQLLVEMDGFEGHQGTVVVAATNRSDILDPALLRPGRFDRQVVVGCPDVKGREEILRVHAAEIAVAPEVDLRAIARGDDRNY